MPDNRRGDRHKAMPIAFRPGPVRDRLVAYSRRTGRAVNAVIRDAVSDYLDKHDHEGGQR